MGRAYEMVIEDAVEEGLHAMAAISEGCVVKLVYLRDVVAEVNDEIADSVHQALYDDRISPVVKALKEHGKVLVGKCCGNTFVTL